MVSVETGSKLNIGVIFGGCSGEHEVSLMSARSLLTEIDPEKYEVTQIGIAPDGSWWVGEHMLEALEQGKYAERCSPAILAPDPTHPEIFVLHRPAASDLAQGGGMGELQPYLEPLARLDVVFPVLHGTFGEDGTLQGLLEMTNLAYVGAGVAGSALGMDKGIFKDVMIANNIPVVETLTLLRREIETNLEQTVQRAELLAEYPLFVKPANLGSSVGISKCTSRADLVEGLMEAACYDRRVLVERGLNAREIEVSVLGNDSPQASTPGEVIPSREFYSYESKYIDGRSELIIPAPLTPQLTERVQELAIAAYRAIDCAGMARVDFLLEKEPEFGDGLYLSEVNTIPGFTSISMYPKLWEASGLTYPALIDRLIDLAVERKRERDRTKRHYKKGD
jgi:D-alanine-D-alanine ligase